MSFVEYVKALTRPTVTLILVVFWGCFIANGTNYPVAFEAATIGALAWWGIDRSLLHRNERRLND